MKDLNNILENYNFIDILLLLTQNKDYEKIIKSYAEKVKEHNVKYLKVITDIIDSDLRYDMLIDEISSFIEVHDKIYLEIGVLRGFNLYQELVNSFSIQTKNLDIKMNDVGKSIVNGNIHYDSILNQICKHRLSTALEESLKNDKEYQEEENKLSDAILEMDSLDLPHKHWNIIDKVFSSHNAVNAKYGEKAYMQGIQDTLELINIFKRRDL